MFDSATATSRTIASALCKDLKIIDQHLGRMVVVIEKR